MTTLVANPHRGVGSKSTTIKMMMIMISAMRLPCNMLNHCIHSIYQNYCMSRAAVRTSPLCLTLKLTCMLISCVFCWR